MIERWTDENLDKLAEIVAKHADAIDKLTEKTDKNTDAMGKLTKESKESTIRLSVSQWVVNLMFGLLATATITTIVTAIFTTIFRR